MRVVPQRVEDDDGLVEWAVGEPGPVLGGLVRSYTGYREEAPTPVHRQETPAAQLTLIVSFGDGFRAEGGGQAGELSDYTSFVAGMHDRPARTAHDGRQFGVQVRLDPLAAFSLLDVPLHELGNRVVELSDLLGADAERWAGRLSSMHTWQDRFALLDGLLADRIATGPAPSPQAVWAWQAMRRAGGVRYDTRRRTAAVAVISWHRLERSSEPVAGQLRSRPALEKNLRFAAWLPQRNASLRSWSTPTSRRLTTSW